jgi:hypothetical protein
MANDGRVREKAHLIRGVALCRMLRRISNSICMGRYWAVSLALGAALSVAPGARAQTGTPDTQPQAGAAAAPQPVTSAELKPAPPTPIAVQKAELGDTDTWNPDWDTMIEKALPADLLSTARERQVRQLCPRFKFLTDADRRAFWAYFFQALAGAEAGLEPTADVRHKDPAVAVIDPVTHRVARQEGLLQLAYMDGTRYGCKFDWDTDKELPEHDAGKTILDPKNNLLCGINILENQLVTKNKPVLSKSSYWETLRPGTYGFTRFMKQMDNEPQACGAPHVRQRWPWRRGRIPAAEAAGQPGGASAPGQTGGADVGSASAAGAGTAGSDAAGAH